MRRRDLLRGTGAALLLSADAPAQKSEPAFESRGSRLVMDLSGPWRLVMDDAGVGMAKRWFAREPSAAEARRFNVVVPSVWQQYQDLQGGVGWYYKDLQVPKELVGKTFRLRFEAVDYRAHVWLNGREAGAHDGGFTPFELDVSGSVKAGVNRLAVRVSDVGRDFRANYCGLPGWDRTTSGRVDGLSFAEIPAGFQDWREGFDHGGIWQPVSLHATAPVYIADLFLAPDLAAGTATAQITLHNRTGREVEAETTVDLRPWQGATGSAGSASQKVRLPADVSEHRLTIRVAQPRLWSVADPFLYVARAAVRMAGQTADDAQARFGLREFTVAPDGGFLLNGEPIFIKGAHYQSTEPVTLAFPRDAQAARRIVEIAKEGGFNFIRGQGRPTVPAILDAADELGILFQCEPAVSKMADHPNMEALAEREVTEMVRRDRNHPSVVIWNMINEQAAGMKVVQKMCRIARALDPTRMMTESAGGNSRYYAPGSPEGNSYLTEHYYPGAPLPEGMLDYLNQRGVDGQLYFVTEFGYGGLQDVDAVLRQYARPPSPATEDYRGFLRQKQDVEEAFAQGDVKEIFSSLADFRRAAQSVQANAVRLHVEAMRANPRLRGYNIVQLFDSNSNEVDGLVDFWRTERKQAFGVMRELNQPVGLVVRCSPYNIESGGETEVSVSLFHERPVAAPMQIRLRATDASGQVLLTEEATFQARTGVSSAFRKRLSLRTPQGRVRLQAEVRHDGRTLATRTAEIDVYAPTAFRWPARGFALFDPQDRWPHAATRPSARPYREGAERPQVIAIPEFSALWKEPRQFEIFLRAVEEARRGSTLLFLGLPSDGAVPDKFRRIHFHLQFSPLTLASVLGFRLDVVSGRGGWGRLVGPYGGGSGEAAAGSPVPRHPIFDGCPGPGLMDWEYGNLATDVILQPSIRAVERTGPAVQILPFGAGKAVFCTLRLLENLGRDALAEKVLSNLVGYLDSVLPETLRPPLARDEEGHQFRLTQVRDCLRLLSV